LRSSGRRPAVNVIVREYTVAIDFILPAGRRGTEAQDGLNAVQDVHPLAERHGMKYKNLDYLTGGGIKSASLK
jgi:hypothetical protein